MRRLVSFCFTAIVLALMTQRGYAERCEREDIFGRDIKFNCPEPGDNPRNRFCCGFGDNKYCCDEDILEIVSEKKLVALAQVQETPVVPKTANDQEGLRDTVGRVKDKVNGTVRAVGGKLNPKVGVQKAKDKIKQKVKDKVEEKAVKKLDPTGGHIKSLPLIAGIIGAVIVAIFITCIICCCCCPFCLLYKHRSRGAVRNPGDAAVSQPLQPMQPQPIPGQQPPYQAQPYPAQPYPPQQPYPAQQPYPTQQPYNPQQGYAQQPGYPPQPYPPQPHGNPPAVYPELKEIA